MYRWLGSACKFAMQLFCCCTISVVRGFWCVEATEVVIDAFGIDCRLPLAFMCTNTFEPGRISNQHASVSFILGFRRLAQIVPAVVAVIRVFVVNFIYWPQRRHNQPSESLAKVSATVVDADSPVAIGIDRSSYLASIMRIPPFWAIISMAPSKLAGERVVGQNRTNIISRQFCPSLWSRHRGARHG